METGHTFAMELASGPTGTARVWDYVGDNFVHRLVMNKPDGKPVEVGEGGLLAPGGEPPTQPYNQEDKLEGITLEVLLQLCLSLFLLNYYTRILVLYILLYFTSLRVYIVLLPYYLFPLLSIISNVVTLVYIMHYRAICIFN